jgi:hypothetical protein
VFSDSYLQPTLQQATDLYEITLRWNGGRTRFKPGAIRRLTRTGDNGWVIPEFAWDPRGRRLLWTQNKFSDGRRLDQGCVVRRIRDDFVNRLRGVGTIGQIPFDLPNQLRERAAELLRDPRGFAGEGVGCGGEEPDRQPAWAQETRIGHYQDD